MKIRLLSQSDVRRTLTMGQAIELMEESFAALTLGTIQVPVRTNITSAAGTMLYKPALMPALKTFAMKAVSIFPGNAERGLPVTTGLILVNDSETGLPLALMDAEYLTALRTGAASGLATRLLANPSTKVAGLAVRRRASFKPCWKFWHWRRSMSSPVIRQTLSLSVMNRSNRQARVVSCLRRRENS